VPEPPPSHPVVELRLLAWRKGYDFDRRRGADSWQLVRVADQAVAAKPGGETTFSFAEAKAFLAALPDA
jgi:hypothetical protein